MKYFKFSPKLWPGLKVFFLVAVLIPLFEPGIGGMVAAAPNDCEKLLSRDGFKKLDKDKVKQIQGGLVRLGYNPREIDGIIAAYNKVFDNIDAVIEYARTQS